MRFVFIFSLFVALSLADDPETASTSVTASSTSPSTAKSSPMSTSATMSTSIESVGTVSSTVSTSTIQSGSTVPVGSTRSVSSTAPISSTTISSSSTTTVTTTTTLPNVDVEYVEFKRSCTIEGDCEYTLVAPHNNQKFLATEQSLLDEDQTVVVNISQKIQQFQQSTANSTGDADMKMRDLANRLQKAKELLDKYQADLLQIQSNLDDTEYQLQFPSLYINMLSYNPQLCYAQCLVPPTTTTTTTTTSGPTTTPDPCSSYQCDNGGGDCQTDSSHTPYCQCPGNLDGYQHCDTGACSDSGIDIMTSPDTTIPFYSPGYYGPSNSSAQETDISCRWTLITSTDGGGYQ
ncbi:EGF domain-containing protein, partial [Trichostrongylus colubriformis]